MMDNAQLRIGLLLLILVLVIFLTLNTMASEDYNKEIKPTNLLENSYSQPDYCNPANKVISKSSLSKLHNIDYNVHLDDVTFLVRYKNQDLDFSPLTQDLVDNFIQNYKAYNNHPTTSSYDVVFAKFLYTIMRLRDCGFDITSLVEDNNTNLIDFINSLISIDEDIIKENALISTNITLDLQPILDYFNIDDISYYFREYEPSTTKVRYKVYSVEFPFSTDLYEISSDKFYELTFLETTDIDSYDYLKEIEQIHSTFSYSSNHAFSYTNAEGEKSFKSFTFSSMYNPEYFFELGNDEKTITADHSIVNYLPLKLSNNLKGYYIDVECRFTRQFHFDDKPFETVNYNGYDFDVYKKELSIDGEIVDVIIGVAYHTDEIHKNTTWLSLTTYTFSDYKLEDFSEFSLEDIDIINKAFETILNHFEFRYTPDLVDILTYRESLYSDDLEVQ